MNIVAFRTLKTALEDKARRFSETPCLWFEDAGGGVQGLHAAQVQHDVAVVDFVLRARRRDGQPPDHETCERPRPNHAAQSSRWARSNERWQRRSSGQPQSSVTRPFLAAPRTIASWACASGRARPWR